MHKTLGPNDEQFNCCYNNALADEPIAIPQYILDIYASVKRQFSARSFDIKAKLDSRVAEWFEQVSKKYGFQVTPYYVYAVAAKHGLKQFAPKRCLCCGKLLDIAKPDLNFALKNACSSLVFYIRRQKKHA